MKKFISLFIFFALSLSAFAQTAGGEWKWARAFGGTDNSSNSYSNFIKQVEYDADGNTYILGIYGQYGCWDDGQAIVNNPTIHSSGQQPLFLAKFDSVGSLLWSRIVKSGQQYTGYVGIQLTDSNITVVGTARLDDPVQTTPGPKWLYFFDTLIRSQDVAATPVAQRHPPFAFGWWTFVTTLDLDGNVQSSVFLEERLRPNYTFPGSLYGYRSSEAFMWGPGLFHKDSEGNNVLICQTKSAGQEEDPLWILVHKQDTTTNSYVTDTFNVFLPGSTEKPEGIAYLTFFKFSPSWELRTFRNLVQGLDGFGASYEYYGDSINPYVKYGITDFDLDDDGNYYIIGSIGVGLTAMYHGELNNYPCHVYFDSSIYLTVNHIDETHYPPFVLKLSPDGIPLWCNQIHGLQNPRYPFQAPFQGIDVSGNYVYIPLIDCIGTIVIPNLGEYSITPPKVAWLKCDKETGVWQQFSVSDTMFNLLAPNHYNNFVHEDHVFITGRYGNIHGFQDFIEHWTTDGTLVDTMNIGRDNQVEQWATIDNRGNLRLRKTITTPQDFGDLHLDYGTNHSMAVIALYHNDAFAVPYHREEQSIIWEQDLNFSLADSPVTLTATSTSGLPVSYSSSDTSIARIDGSTLHLLAGGSCTILATCPDNDYYQAAAPVSKTLTVGQSGITDHEASPLLIYPNPSRGYMNLYGPTDQISSITLYDMAGREVYHHTRTIFLNATPADQGPCYSLNISHLPQGSYIVKVSTANGQAQHLKLIKK
ncbi:MAG: T9SS type A sorting domain-containing protein [Bacteroidales bacterium]|nr:T9SS type A sorting domain-containing protein [Bacteroidales bacterium]